MAIPSEHQAYIEKFRAYIKDEADLNDFYQTEENTDEFLYSCLVDAVDEINYAGNPLTDYTVGDFPSWFILKITALIQYLIGTGIHSARNQFSYSDPSGIQVRDTDTYGRYVNYYNVLITKKENIVNRFKRNINIENCYDVG